MAAFNQGGGAGVNPVVAHNLPGSSSDAPSLATNRVSSPSAFPKPVISICLLRNVEVVKPDGNIDIVTALEAEWVARGQNGNGHSVAFGSEDNPHYMDAAEFARYAYPSNGDFNQNVAKSADAAPTVYSHIYELTREIKETIFGSVHHGIILIPNPAGDGRFVRMQPYKQVAVKVYYKSRLRSLRGRTHENPLCEIAAMQFMGQHMHVISQLECCSDGDNVYSIMEFIEGGELYDLVGDESGGGAVAEGLTRDLFRQLVLGLRHLHERGVGHRDFSLENVMYSPPKPNQGQRQGVVKIIDFGMCMRVPKDEATGVLLKVPPQGSCGKKNYIAPEVLENVSAFNPLMVDIWALGVILFIMLTGYPPMDAATPVDLRYRMVAAGQIGALLEGWGVRMNPGPLDLISRILRPDPADRLTLKEIAEHPWVTAP